MRPSDFATLLLIGTALYSLLSNLKKATPEITPSIPNHNPNLINVGYEPLDAIYDRVGKRVGVDPLLLKAIAIHESSERPDAVNLATHDYGLMQIHCEADGPNSRCKNALPAVPEFQNATPQRLLDDVTLNVTIAARILKWNIDNYGARKGIAVYNRWSSRLEREPFGNQDYLDGVLRKYASLTARKNGVIT